MIQQYAGASLTVDLPKYGFCKGDPCVVVEVFNAGEGYAVEFFSPEGDTLDVIIVDGDQIGATLRRAPAPPRHT